MKKINQAGLLLCDLQARIFEMSIESLDCSSEIFMRRFMKSNAAKILDSEAALDTIIIPKDIINSIEEQYGSTAYGSVKYTANEMFWIGYIYRYFSYTYEISSSQAFKLIKPKELKLFYPACHTMDCEQAIERFLEAKEISLDLDVKKQYQVFRRIRSEHMAEMN